MTSIPELITAQDYEGLVKFCENFELTALSESNNTSLTDIYAVYLAAYILTNDLQSARYLRKRILNNKQQTPEIDAIWAVAASLISQNYPTVYTSLDSFQWTQWMQPLAVKITEKTRNHVLDMISTVYTSIQVVQAAALFGLSQAEVVKVLTESNGWTLNEGLGILYPVKPVVSGRLDDGSSNGGQFEKLADIVFNLEKF